MKARLDPSIVATRVRLGCRGSSVCHGASAPPFLTRRTVVFACFGDHRLQLRNLVLVAIIEITALQLKRPFLLANAGNHFPIVGVRPSERLFGIVERRAGGGAFARILGSGFGTDPRCLSISRGCSTMGSDGRRASGSPRCRSAGPSSLKDGDAFRRSGLSAGSAAMCSAFEPRKIVPRGVV